MTSRRLNDKKSNEKRSLQLGLNVGTASNKLIKDILFDLIDKAGMVCFHCGGPMSRLDFSIEHKTPWLDSEKPRELFFDLENISFSHLKCNISKARKPTKLPDGERLRRKRALQVQRRLEQPLTEKQIERRARYLKYKK